MGRKRTSISGIDVKQLDQQIRRSKDVRQRERLSALKMASSGQYTLQMIAEAVGRARSVIQQWLAKFDEGGIEAMLDRKKPNGRKTPLQKHMHEQIEKHLQQGSWRSANEMQRWLEDKHQIKMGLGGCYYWLGKHGGHLKVPRPVHREQKPGSIEAFKTSVWKQKLDELNIAKGEEVEFWVMDESRFGLHSIVRRCWGAKGVRIIKPFQQKFEWEYVYGALNLHSGEPVQCFLPTVSKDATWSFLQEVVKTNPKAHHVILWDGAGFHQKPLQQELEADEWEALKKVHVIGLPPYCPELNPVEKLWDQLKDSVCNRVFKTLEELRAALEPKMREFWETPQKILSLLGENWLRQKTNNGYPTILPLSN